MFAYRRLLVWRTALDAPPPARPSDEFGPASGANAFELAAAMAVPPAAVVKRLGWARCYLGRVDDRIVAYGWVSEVETPIGEIDSALRPAAGEAYIWNCATIPSYRGRGLYTTLLGHIKAELGAIGIRSAWIAGLGGNRAGVRGVLRAGFHPVLAVRYFRLLRFRRWRLTPLGSSPEEVERAKQALQLGHSLTIPAPAAQRR